MIRFLIVLTFLVLFLIVTIPLMLVVWIISKFNYEKSHLIALRTVQWAFRVVLFFSGVKLTIIGQEKIPTDKPVLYVGNHRSIFDVIITYTLCPRITGYVAKDSLLKVPLLNLWMLLIGCEFLDRSDIKKGMKLILKCIDEVKNHNMSYCIFPEGTRSKEPDTFLPFKDGSFKIAKKAGCAVVPMSLVNTASIFEDHLPKICKTHVILEYCDPIYLDTLEKEDATHVGAYVQHIVEEAYWKNKPLLEEK